MERQKALHLLYDHIQNKSKVHDHIAVESYEETSDGILVTTSDGNSHSGSILVGADGIHSRVRKLVAEKLGANNHALALDMNQGMLCTNCF